MSTRPTIIPIFQILVTALISLCLLVSCDPAPVVTYEADQSEYYEEAAVVTGHPLASDVGKDILAKGGNAVDAAVAVQLALAVVYPRAGNIGGGGFLVYRAADGTVSALDYREKAPAKANRDMYLDSLGEPIQGLSTKGHLAAGVPGTVAGMVEAHKRYGSLPWAELVQPAIDLAKQGYTISETEAERLNRFQEDFARYNNESCPFIKSEWAIGDILRQTGLAATLERIRDKQRAGFYEGETADLIVAEMESGGGYI